MKLTNTQSLLIALIILVLIFILGKCSLVCGSFKVENMKHSSHHTKNHNKGEVDSCSGSGPISYSNGAVANVYLATEGCSQYVTVSDEGLLMLSDSPPSQPFGLWVFSNGGGSSGTLQYGDEFYLGIGANPINGICSQSFGQCQFGLGSGSSATFKLEGSGTVNYGDTFPLQIYLGQGDWHTVNTSSEYGLNIGYSSGTLRLALYPASS